MIGGAGVNLTDTQLEALIAAGETERCEFKRRLKDAKDDVCHDICAFSNDLPGSGEPGYVFIGIENDGASAALQVTDELVREVAQIRLNGNIVPWPTMSVEVRRLMGADVVVVEVAPHDHPPVRYDGRVCTRVGTVRAVASPQEEIRLAERRRAADLPFVLRPALGSDLGDLDIEYIKTTYVPAAISPDVLAQNQRTIEHQLASLRLLTADAAMPTNGGLLLAGLDPSVFIPAARVELTRFEGTDRAGAIRDRHELTTGLFRVFEQLETLLPLTIETRSEPGDGLRRADHAAYPSWALREYVFNALIHRNYEQTAAPTRVDWYDDRVEITSPGGLYGHVTPANFRHMNDYRNQLLAAAAKTMGWVERVGQGIARAERLLAENGNPAPEYEFEPDYVLVMVRSAFA